MRVWTNDGEIHDPAHDLCCRVCLHNGIPIAGQTACVCKDLLITLYMPEEMSVPPMLISSGDTGN